MEGAACPAPNTAPALGAHGGGLVPQGPGGERSRSHRGMGRPRGSSPTASPAPPRRGREPGAPGADRPLATCPPRGSSWAGAAPQSPTGGGSRRGVGRPAGRAWGGPLAGAALPPGFPEPAPGTRTGSGSPRAPLRPPPSLPPRCTPGPCAPRLRPAPRPDPRRALPARGSAGVASPDPGRTARDLPPARPPAKQPARRGAQGEGFSQARTQQLLFTFLAPPAPGPSDLSRRGNKPSRHVLQPPPAPGSQRPACLSPLLPPPPGQARVSLRPAPCAFSGYQLLHSHAHRPREPAGVRLASGGAWAGRRGKTHIEPPGRPDSGSHFTANLLQERAGWPGSGGG
ncbi:group 10 secretory phospholipase A2 [Platysternon megacephalum]|uniref:Group 10 secretory phospholipase A2 n=1 Tax=Platysternon megacephalum TaxID=55544 RepID=A0A4D9DT72_9SAUR|nr:group 10 secretory phospholipase A2 [Platysternon megacephalum]